MTQILEQDDSVAPIILTNREGPFNARWKARGWRIINSNINWGNKLVKQSPVSKLLDLARSNYKAYITLKENKLKLLYCNDIQGFWCAYFGGKLAGVKVVFNLRDTKSEQELALLGKWAYIARKADVIIVLSQEMKDFVVDKLLNNQNSEKVYVTYSIVNHDVFKPADGAYIRQERQALQIKPDEFVISYVATFNDKKAQLPFIEKVITGFKNNPGIRFFFVGDFTPDTNPYARQCLEAVKSRGLEHLVKFVGHDNHIDRWYKISDLVAIASVKEGLARCMIEALSCATPVVSFDVCSANEILNGYYCGEVVKMGNYDDFIKKIQILRNDADLSKIYGENGVKLSSALFDKLVVIEKYQLIYDKITNLA